MVRLPNATSRSARSARRWRTFWASVCDSPSAARASTVVRANPSRRTARWPASRRQPAARNPSTPHASAGSTASNPHGPISGHAAAPTTSPATDGGSAYRRSARRGNGVQPVQVVGQLGQQGVEERAHLGAPQEREERLGGGLLLGVADHLHAQRGQPERTP